MLLLLNTLEKAINTLIKQDPLTHTHIQSLNGKTFLLHITDLNLKLYLQIQNQLACLYSHWDEDIDTQVSGKLFGLINTATGQEQNQTVSNNSVTISGNLKAGEQLRLILSKINIDREGLLAKKLGGPLANQVNRMIEKTQAGIKKVRYNLHRQIKEYSHQEGKIAVRPHQLTNFKNDIQQLKTSTKKLEEKIAKLKSQGG